MIPLAGPRIAADALFELCDARLCNVSARSISAKIGIPAPITLAGGRPSETGECDGESEPSPNSGTGPEVLCHDRQLGMTRFAQGWPERS
ncbi:hypothetical protein AB0C34_20500 [Nocardia sp. NPDC049220]|uniref:hypothetical protein n=1 Tax=Nocardia sp. NPDC049220 TaxID=3155273 RepID=UPI0033DD763F